MAQRLALNLLCWAGGWFADGGHGAMTELPRLPLENWNAGTEEEVGELVTDGLLTNAGLGYGNQSDKPMTG